MKYRPLSTEELVALQIINCCANAIADNLPKLERRMKSAGLGSLAGLVKGSVSILRRVVDGVLAQAPDPDQREMVIRRMNHLQLQFGFVRKHPESMLVMDLKDAETLIAPCLEKCDLECPCLTGDREVNLALVKQCETRKALRRLGMAEMGLGSECPYQMLIGGRK